MLMDNPRGKTKSGNLCFLLFHATLRMRSKKACGWVCVCVCVCMLCDGEIEKDGKELYVRINMLWHI